jgi:hypothetical protein
MSIQVTKSGHGHEQVATRTELPIELPPPQILRSMEDVPSIIPFKNVGGLGARRLLCCHNSHGI